MYLQNLMNFGRQTAEITLLMFTHPLRFSHPLHCQCVHTEVVRTRINHTFSHLRNETDLKISA